MAAARRLPDLGITHRRTGISTVGWAPGIRKLTESDMPIRLALSLHAPEDALRSKIMPVNERYPIAEVLEACEAYYERRRRKVFVEYVMLAGVNDAYGQAVQLTKLLDPRIYKLNLIPYNPTGSIYEGSSRGAIDAFKAALEEHGLRRDRTADARPRHRRRLRAAGGGGQSRSGGVALSTDAASVAAGRNFEEAREMPANAPLTLRARHRRARPPRAAGGRAARPGPPGSGPTARARAAPRSSAGRTA